MAVHALFLNCTLKQTPKESNTRALIDKLVALYAQKAVTTEVLRMTDYTIRRGVTYDEGDGDEWPWIIERIKNCDILIIATPVWLGAKSSVAQQVLERLEAAYTKVDEETGQYLLYNKVGAAVVTGNEDGAQTAARDLLYTLSHYGCTIPPNADCYWVGKAGAGPSYIESGGDKHLFTNRTARMLVHNTLSLARMLKKHPLTTNLKEIDEQAEQASSSESD